MGINIQLCGKLPALPPSSNPPPTCARSASALSPLSAARTSTATTAARGSRPPSPTTKQKMSECPNPGGSTADAPVIARQSARRAGENLLNKPAFCRLVDALKTNKPDVAVLRMKEYVSDSDTPPIVMDAFLDALENNTNCQALYI